MKEKKDSDAIAMRVARLAYSGVKEADSYRSMERRIFVNHLGGVAMGTINHSENFFSSFVDSLDLTVLARLKSHFSTETKPSSATISPSAQPSAPPCNTLCNR